MTVSSRSVPFAVPDMGRAEVEAVAEVIVSGWLTTSERCREFEQAFAEYVGAAHAVAVNSCTAALHLALEGLGLQRGAVVVTTPYAFAATAEVIRYFDAVPVFVDVDPTTCNIDVDLLEKTVARLADGDTGPLPPALRESARATRPRVVIPVHIAGVPCDLDRIYKVAATYDMAVVEDAAHAFPAAIGSRLVGASTDPSVSAAVCFSFYATKTITTGEGGMLVTDDAVRADRARRMSLHGLNRDAWSRHNSSGSWRYDIEAPGYKYNLTDIAAAMGLVQLGRAAQMAARRTEVARRYQEAFSEGPGLEVPTVPTGVNSAWHLFMLRLHPDRLHITRDRFIEELAAQGVGTSVHFIPLHVHSYYRNMLGYASNDLPVAMRQFEREISLPIYSRMSDEDVDHVCRAVVDVATRFGR